MKKSKLMFFTSIFIAVIFISSCGNLNDKSKDNLQNSDSSKTEVITDNSIPETPASISELAKPLNIDMRNAAYNWIKAVKMTDYKSEEKNPKLYPVVFIPYGLFNLGDYMDKKILESGNKDISNSTDTKDAFKSFLNTFKNKVMYQIYSSKNLQETAYTWLLPEWKTALSSMDPERKQLIKNILKYMINYTQNYKYNKELAFYNECKGEKESYFTSTFPIINGKEVYQKGSSKPYRKAEAWVFRRVHQNQMTANDINKWLKKIKKDLSL